MAQGHGIELDQIEAARHMGKAAEGGLAVAQLNFGFMAAKVVNHPACAFLSLGCYDHEVLNF